MPACRLRLNALTCQAGYVLQRVDVDWTGYPTEQSAKCPTGEG